MSGLLKTVGDLPALPGPVGIGEVPVWSGNVLYRAPASLLTQADGIDPCSPEYGAVGDGATDDKAALLLAIAAGIAANKPVKGYGRTYGIVGNLALVANTWLEGIKCKQLTPGGGTRRTLTSAGGSNIALVDVTVDRNGDGTNGVHQADAGVYISGGSGHYFKKVEVYGDDIGSGFTVENATDFEADGIYAHDIKYLLGADPGNDRVQGLHFSGCSRFVVRNCRAEDIGGDFGGGYTLRYSRGYCWSGCTEFEVLDCRGRMLDQGSDMTGSVGNSRFQFSDCHISDCLTYCFKFANTARDGQVDNCTGTRANLSGFIVSGSSASGMTAVTTQDIQFTGCVAYDVGYAGLPGVAVPGTKVGFRVNDGAFDVGETRGIRFIDCKAHDRQAVKTMALGGLNDVAANSDGRYNEAINCVSIGHITGGFAAFNAPRCEVGRSAVQSIPSHASNWETVLRTSETDLGEMHPANSATVYARRFGYYSSRWGVVFAASATGQRGVRITRNGTAIPGTTQLVDAAAAGETALQVSWSAAMDPGDYLSVQVFNNSGGALNLQTTSGGVVEQVS